MKIEDLLLMNESPKLDFKRIWKDEDVKSELIKDILSLGACRASSITAKIL